MKPVEVSFKPVDNQRLANLCGTLDENLRALETSLDVSIARRGERFSLSRRTGPRIAATALQNLYRQARRVLSPKTSSSA